MKLNRRTFIKSSIEGAAGLTLVGSVVTSTVGKPLQAGLSWTDKKPLNPDIDNMRVVCMHDPDMCTNPTSSTFSKVNAAVNVDKVSENMDKMAMGLSKKSMAEDAWKTIFHSSKEWKDTKAIIKVNSANARNMPRSAIIRKIADVLIGFGAKSDNITVFDGHGNAGAGGKYIAAEVNAKVSNAFDGLGGVQSVTIPNVSNIIGPKELVAGTTDIIVNVATHRGHNMSFNGGATLCLKNHYGTFLDNNKRTAEPLHNFTAFININKHELIVGGTPVKQQLCIIDSLWGAQDGPFESSADQKLDRIVMGTFAGAVDYYLVKKIRQELKKWNHDNTVIAKYLTEFGYMESDTDWLEMTPQWTPEITQAGMVPPAGGNRVLSLTVSGRSSIRFNIPADERRIHLRVFDMRGALVQEFTRDGKTDLQITWDGRSGSGRQIASGSYVVRVTGKRMDLSNRLVIR